MKEGPQHFFIKIYSSFYSFERGQTSVVQETDWDKETKTDNYIDP